MDTEPYVLPGERRVPELGKLLERNRPTEPKSSNVGSILTVVALVGILGAGAWVLTRQPKGGVITNVLGPREPERFRPKFVGPTQAGQPPAPARPAPSRAQAPVSPSPEPAAPAVEGRRRPRSTSPVSPPPAAATSPMREAEQVFRDARARYDRGDYAGAADGFSRVIALVEHEADLGADLRRVATEFAAMSRERAGRDATRLFTERDAGVTAPVVLVGSSLPPKPSTDAPAERLDVLEIVIDANGAVESARLITARNHYRNRWWASAAKAWRFQPATRNGRPVRFLKRIPIDDGGLP